MLLDLVLVGILAVTVGPLLGGLLGGLAGGAAGGATGLGMEAGSGMDLAAAGAAGGGILGMLLGAMLGIVLVLVLYGLIEGLVGASPGKMLLGIRIGKDDGSQASVPTLLARYAIKNSAMLLSFVAVIVGVSAIQTLGQVAGLIVGLGCFLVLGSARQALHDKLAKAAVHWKRDLRPA
jgi:uncharacterized RDD family membrane protein YckC